MDSDDEILPIFSRLRDMVKNLDSNDVIEEIDKSSPYKKSYKYKSKRKRGNPYRKFILFIHLPKRQNKVIIQLCTGKYGDIIDKKGITTPETGWDHIKKKLIVTSEGLDSGEITYEDIEDLMNQGYNLLK